MYDSEVMDPYTLQARAVELGLTPALARTAVVLDVRAGQDGTAAVFRISLLRTVREFSATARIWPAKSPPGGTRCCTP